MLIHRNIFERIKPFLKRKEFIAIVGPRQAGKTTFLDILKDYLINNEKVDKDSVQTVTFEDRMLLRQFVNDPVSFVRSYMPEKSGKPAYLLIDEFQYAKDGGQRLKLIYDTVPDIKIIITGSSSLEIKSMIGKYLVGRILTFHMYPFNFQEYLRAVNPKLEKIYIERHTHIVGWLSNKKIAKLPKGKDYYNEEMLKHYEKYCVWGGYPAVVTSRTDKERIKILGDIYNNYLLKDIKGLLELATDDNLFLLSQYLATQIGNIVVYDTLGKTSRLDYRQVIKHLNILKETFVCKELRPFFINRQKELTKNPKIYFYDIGFRNYLLENMNPPEKRSDGGDMIENAVFIRLNDFFGEMRKINFWRTKAGAEVDFVLRAGENIYPIEVKYSIYDKAKASKSFMNFIESFKPTRGLILTKDYWGTTKKNNTKILFAPVYYL